MLILLLILLLPEFSHQLGAFELIHKCIGDGLEYHIFYEAIEGKKVTESEYIASERRDRHGVSDRID